MRYRKAPILEAVLEFRWSSSKSLEELRIALSSSAFEDFEEPKSRNQLDTTVKLDGSAYSHEKRQIGFEATLRDGLQIVFLEEQKFIFVQRAPYDRWEYFSERALALLAPTVEALGIEEFSRVGLRFVNRIDIPEQKIDTDDYVTVRFDGPRQDRGAIEELQMRVVKPSEKEGLHYALILATTKSPWPDYSSILLDIDVFTREPIPAKGEKLMHVLGEMRREKNEIFEECVTDRARDLFGGVEE